MIEDVARLGGRLVVQTAQEAVLEAEAEAELFPGSVPAARCTAEAGAREPALASSRAGARTP